MRTTEIIIADKCKRGESHGSLLFASKLRNGKLIMIPFSTIQSKEDAEIVVTDTHKERATAFNVHTWYFEKIEADLRAMRSEDVVLPK